MAQLYFGLSGRKRKEVAFGVFSGIPPKGESLKPRQNTRSVIP